MNIISLELSNKKGNAVYTVGNKPIQNAWISTWDEIIDEIEIQTSKNIVNIMITFIDGKKTIMAAYSNQVMVTKEDNIESYEKFKEMRLEETTLSEFAENENELMQGIIPINISKENNDGQN